MFNTILVHPIFNLLAIIYAVIPGHDFGISVILLTILMRLLLWRVTSKQLHSQKAMQELQPEIAKVRAKAKGDRQLESKMLMELYKEREINPFASLLPLLVQLPLFIALYLALKDVIKPGEITHLLYGPLKSFGVLSQIVHGQVAFRTSLLGIVDLAKPNVFLAVIAAASQFVQTRQLMAANASKDPSARLMNNVTMLFPLLTGFIALRLPSALALYWTTNSVFTVFQQWWFLRKDVAEMEGDKK